MLDVDTAIGALATLDQTPLPASLVVATGGGLHCYWLFHEAEAATPEAVARIEAALRRLADHIGGDPQCAECARLMRVPGTTNYKREVPVAVCLLEDRPAARYELAELEEWLAEARAPTDWGAGVAPNQAAAGAGGKKERALGDGRGRGAPRALIGYGASTRYSRTHGGRW